MKCYKCSNPIELVTKRDPQTKMFCNYWNCDDCGKTKPLSETSLTFEDFQRALELFRENFKRLID